MNPNKFSVKQVLIGIFLFAIFLVTFSFVKGIISHRSVLLGSAASGAPNMMYAERGFAKGGAMGIASNVLGDTPSYDSATVATYQDPPSLPSSPPSPPLGDAKIIKSGNLSLLVKNTEETALKIDAIRTSLSGQPGNASFREYSPGVKSGNITIWVPADKFGEAMADIKKLSLRVENESVNVQDVSAQFVDISSRLKNLHAAEAAYVEIMKRSGKISEVLEVTRALNDTRSQIEQLQGQLDYLTRQTALSSIDVYLSQEAIPGAVTNEWRPTTIVKAAAKQALNDLTDFIDMLLVMLVRLPVMLLYLAWWFLIFWLVYRAARFLYHRLKQSTMFGPLKQ